MLALLIAVLVAAFAIARLKLHPFLVLLLAGLALGPALDLSLLRTLELLAEGFGKTAGQVGLLIALGALIGGALEAAGALQALASSLVDRRDPKRTVWALGALGALVSVSVFCDAGFVLLFPLCRALAQQGTVPLRSLSTALALGLYSSHVFLPPTPGPLAAANLLGASLGTLVPLAVLVVLVVLVSTSLFATWVGRHEPRAVTVEVLPAGPRSFRGLRSLALLLLPLALMTLGAVAALPQAPFGSLTGLVCALGQPVMALLLTLGAASLCLPRGTGTAWMGGALRGVGEVILVTCAGAGFGAVLRASALQDSLATWMPTVDLGAATLLIPFACAALIKTAVGSSTVAMVTSAAALQPFLAQLGFGSGLGATLATLAVGAGAMTVSHLNDSYFWVVTQLSGDSPQAGLRTLTLGSAIAGLSALLTLLVLAAALL